MHFDNVTHVTQLDLDEFVVAGDWHGSKWQAIRVLDYAEEKSAKVVVVLGDFGVWHGEPGGRFLKGLNNELVERDMLVLFVDGNHENFDVLYSYPEEPGGHRIVRSNIWHLPRGLRWVWRGIRFAALGGAHSVDRDMRREGVDWWPQEWVTDDELALFADGGETDVVFMHDSPAGAPNSVTDNPLRQAKGAEWFGQHNLDLATNHRLRLETAITPANPGLIMHGHYHEHMQGVYGQPSGRQTYVWGLDEGQAPLRRHTQLLSTLELHTVLDFSEELE
jgi:Icc-related predicted phosphoesterase